MALEPFCIPVQMDTIPPGSKIAPNALTIIYYVELGKPYQLAFTAGKVKDAEDMEHFQDTAIRYGEIADEMFELWNIPGRYLVFGDKADLAAMREKELEPVEYYTEDDDGDGECTCLRCALEEYLNQLGGMADIIAEAIEELDALEA